MRDIRIDEPPRKLNTEQLTQEVAAALGLPPSGVGVSTGGRGLTVHVPDGSDAGRVVTAVAAHAPERDDREELEHRKRAELDAKLADSPLVQGLLAEIRRLQGA